MTHDETPLRLLSVLLAQQYTQMVLEVRLSPQGRTALMEEDLDTEDSTLTILDQM